MKRKKRIKFLLILAGFLIIGGALGFFGSRLRKRVKGEEDAFTEGNEREENWITGKWKSIAIEVNGERTQLNNWEDDSLIITLAINKSGQATLTYEGYTVIGNMTQSGEKYFIDTDEDALIEVIVDQDNIFVNIIKEPLAESEEETFYWVCERIE